MRHVRRPSIWLLLLGSSALLALAVLGLLTEVARWWVAIPLTVSAFVLFGLGLGGMRAAQLQLRDITGRVKAMGRGEGEVARLEETEGELGSLAASINTLADSLNLRTATANKQSQQLLAILSSMVEGVIAVDSDERVVHLNEAAARILALPAQGAIGQRIWEVLRNPQVLQPLQDVLRDGAERSAEVLIPGRQSDQVIELAAAALRSSGSNVAGAVAVLHDVTELRRLQGIRKDFVANVSHELKTPLTAISGMVETLLEDPDMTPEQSIHFLRRVHAQSDRLTALVQDLLALSRIESDSYSLVMERIDVGAILRDSLRTLAPRASNGGLEVVTTLPDLPVLAYTNAEALRQIVDNLIDNAIKYTPEGGRIVVLLQEKSGRLVCSVSDTGVGIPEDEQERVFERFYRVDKARSREVGGTGLGLSIVKHLSRSIGADVAVSSRLGEGSTFTLTMPSLSGGGIRQEKGSAGVAA